jgi:GSH-dependent disulfide-bond oxidoreductase
MLKFYFHATPNSMKVALLLEELQLPYEVISVDIFKGEQHSPEFRKINPNAKLPAIVDDGVTVFDSHAILLYLAEKHRRFIPTELSQRAAMLSWLEMVATGLSPFSGQAVHFLHYAPESLPYAKNRYVKEVERHYRVLDQRLAEAPYLAGDEYSVADMALWGWANSAGYIFGDKGLGDYPNLMRLVDRIAARPAMARVVRLREQHQFKAELDDQARRAMFPQNETALA